MIHGIPKTDPVDFPEGFVNHVQYSYIEFNKLMKDPHEYTTHIQGVVKGLNQIASDAANQEPIMFPHLVSAIRLIDDVYKEWGGVDQSMYIQEAIRRTNEISKYLERAVHIIMEKEECEDRMKLCIEISKTITPYSHAIVRH